MILHWSHVEHRSTLSEAGRGVPRSRTSGVGSPVECAFSRSPPRLFRESWIRLVIVEPHANWTLSEALFDARWTLGDTRKRILELWGLMLARGGLWAVRRKSQSRVRAWESLDYCSRSLRILWLVLAWDERDASQCSRYLIPFPEPSSKETLHTTNTTLCCGRALQYKPDMPSDRAAIAAVSRYGQQRPDEVDLDCRRR